ncbi:MAG TPA: SRPBCC domain-containing protein [Rhizobiaceae bacterium]|nr:SRPBCC domain-containing protein [Rhizobiaceae bacterium]
MMEPADQEMPESAELSVVTECDLPHPPEKVWRALTVPELLGAWLMPNDIRPVEGERFSLHESGPTGDRVDCEMLEAEPYRRLRYSWRDGEARDNALTSVVTFELSQAREGGTHLRIVHSGAREQVPTMALQAANTNVAGPLMRAA